ncbi:hypothetical protein D3C72_1697070 [compost metagenome]
MSNRLSERGVRLDIGLVTVPDRRGFAFEIGILDQQSILMIFVHRQQHRMTLAQEQAATWLEQSRYRARPAIDARQPDQSTDTGVDQIEATGSQYLVSGIDIRLDIVD